MSKAREIAELGDVVTVDGSNVGIGTSSPQNTLDVFGSTGIYQRHSSGGRIVLDDSDTADASTPMSYIANTAGALQFGRANRNASTGLTTSSVESMRIDSSGNLLVGKTAPTISTDGAELRPTGEVVATTNGLNVAYFNRRSSDGSIAEFRKDGTTVGTIGVAGQDFTISGVGTTSGIYLNANGIIPLLGGNLSDNTEDIGQSNFRFDDIYATNGTIQTSDANEKQQIAELTAAEMDAAKAISKLFKTFKWNDAVAEKGDAARTHAGVIAQEVEAAMTAAGLNAGDYAFFISSTWWESTEVIPAVDEVLDEEGNVVTEAQPERTVKHTHDTQEEAPEGAVEKTRKGIRYPELLSFVGAATEQRLASIEARLDALETV
jgi:hypothetical protein